MTGDSSLSEGALLIAKLDNEDVDVPGYLQEIQSMGRQIKEIVPADATEEKKREILHRYLFSELGFHGSRSDYYNRSNSYLNEVIDDREGLPITLAVLYLDLARRCGMKVEGVGLPGHFMVEQTLPDGKKAYIDVFDKGEVLTREQIEKQIAATIGEPPREEHFRPYTVRQTLVRMLNNLFGAAQDKEENHAMLRYAETLVTVDPEGPDHRIKRAILRFQARIIRGTGRCDLGAGQETRGCGPGTSLNRGA
ncbi:MAG: transglutaminase-like domain-containing protein [Planctomycetales bacterium]